MESDPQPKPQLTAAPAKKIRLTIGAKLIGLIAILLLGSVVVLVWLSTNMFVEDNTALIQQMTSDTAGSLATRMRENFQDVTDKMRMLGTVMVQETLPPEARSRVTQEFFSKDKDFLALIVNSAADTGTPMILGKAISPELTTTGDADGVKALTALAGSKDYSISAISRGAIQLAAFRLEDGSTVLALGLPFIASESANTTSASKFTHTLTALIRQSKFLKAVSENDTVTSYMVDQRGRLIAHPDAVRAAATEDVSQVSIVHIMLEGKAGNGQTRYPDPQTGEIRLGSFRLVGFGGLGIVSEVPESKAFEAAQGVKRRSMYFALIILSVAFFAGYRFSSRIANRIKALVDAAHRISLGDFAVNLKPKGGDEVSTLSLAFNDMAKGLEERDRVKETFNKFHNKEIADKLLSGEVKLGGERKEATIFFSDVRGFTAMSESMEPEQVVEMLNEYMTRMVSIIRAHNGIVDKYVGDAIMAIWGVPIGTENDALNAVKSCIEMRSELARLNELRLSRGQNALKIGMGLNTGSVIAGNIGSNEKMEYTVIGDSVNLASRMESMTKEYGTDLLVPRVIQERLKDKFVFEQCASAKVKGKTQAIEIFKVKGYIDESGQPVLVETAYSSYESEKSDKVVHDTPPEPVVTTLATPPPPSAAAIEASRRIQRPSLAELLTPPPAPEPAAEAEAEPEILAGDLLEVADEWFVLDEKNATGPFSEKQIYDGIASSVYSPETQIADNREGPWGPLKEREEFGGIPADEIAPEPETLPTPVPTFAPTDGPTRTSTVIPAKARTQSTIIPPPPPPAATQTMLTPPAQPLQAPPPPPAPARSASVTRLPSNTPRARRRTPRPVGRTRKPQAQAAAPADTAEAATSVGLQALEVVEPVSKKSA